MPTTYLSSPADKAFVWHHWLKETRIQHLQMMMIGPHLVLEGVVFVDKEVLVIHAKQVVAEGGDEQLVVRFALRM